MMMSGNNVKLIVTFLVFFLCIQINAQQSILMEKEGGVYTLPCSVNGSKMRFIFDTGASRVCISLSKAKYLFDNGFLRKSDIIGTSKSFVASGDVIDNLDIILRDVEIAGLHLKNVHASVIKSLNAPLLLGQTAIQKLGSVTIEGNKLIINNASRLYSSNEADELESTILKCYEEKDYKGVVRYLYDLERGWGLNDYLYRVLIVSCYNASLYEDCLDACKRYLFDNKAYKRDIDFLQIYDTMADCYRYQKQYTLSIDTGIKGLSYLSKESTSEIEIGLLYNLGCCYGEINEMDRFRFYFNKAFNKLLETEKITMVEISKGKVRNKILNVLLRKMGYYNMYHGNITEGTHYFALGAVCDDVECISYCRKYGINYKQEAKGLSLYYKAMEKTNNKSRKK